MGDREAAPADDQNQRRGPGNRISSWLVRITGDALGGGQSPGLGQPWVLSARHPSWCLLGSEEFVGVENPRIWYQKGRHE